MLRPLMLFVLLLALVATVPAVAVDAPTPGKDLMDNPIPPGEDPGSGPRKIKTCATDPTACETHPVPVWSAESGFTGLDGQGMGYCVSYVLPDGTPGHVNVPFHRPSASDPEAFRASVANAIRGLGGANLTRCLAKAARLPLHAQGKAAAVCHAHAATVERQAAGVTFSWEVSRPTPVNGNEPGIVCSCATLIADPSVVGPKYACGGTCGNCMVCN